jgi:predicted ester cyclase
MADYKDLTLRFMKEVIDNQNIDAIDDLVAKDAVDHELPKEMNLPPGREGIKQYFRMMLGAFSNVHAEVEDIIVEGNKVAVRSTMRGVHTGEFMGIKPTKKPVTLEYMDIVRYKGDKVVEHWGQSDNLKLLQQLGVVPKM